MVVTWCLHPYSSTCQRKSCMPHPSTFASWTNVASGGFLWWALTSSSLSKTTSWTQFCLQRRRQLSKVCSSFCACHILNITLYLAAEQASTPTATPTGSIKDFGEAIKIEEGIDDISVSYVYDITVEQTELIQIRYTFFSLEFFSFSLS